MDDKLEKLKEFQDVFQTPNTPEFWKSLVDEEAKEVIEAMENLIHAMEKLRKENADLAYVRAGLQNSGHKGAIEYVWDQLTSKGVDALLSKLDILNLDGIDDKMFNLVHENNMSKVHKDGTIKRREDGKILKPDTYKPVDFEKLYE